MGLMRYSFTVWVDVETFFHRLRWNMFGCVTANVFSTHLKCRNSMSFFFFFLFCFHLSDLPTHECVLYFIWVWKMRINVNIGNTSLWTIYKRNKKLELLWIRANELSPTTIHKKRVTFSLSLSIDANQN